MSETLIRPITRRTGPALTALFLDAARDATGRVAACLEMRSLNRDEARFVPHEYIASLKDYVTSGTLTGFDVVDSAGSLAAFVMFKKNFADIEALWCRDVLRGQGIGSKLLQRAAHRIADCGFTEMETRIGEANRPAQQFFKLKGWRSTDLVVGESADFRRYTCNLH